MEIIGYLAAILIGVSLGLIGGGGSILTVPVLVYLFGVDAGTATFYSLFIVGLTSAVGSYTYLKKGLVHGKVALYFGLPSILVVLLTRTYLVPAIPEIIFKIESFVITKDLFLMVVFAVLMIFAAFSMIKKCVGEDCLPKENLTLKISVLMLNGAVVGLITGLIGAGGGFLIIPALVNLLGLDIKKAIGTSLVIIALNALIGFSASVTHFETDWSLLLRIFGLAMIGVFIGSYLSKKVESKKLKPAFGYFVLIMGIYIILQETIFK